MLGMMNCSSDAVEFYAANDRKFTSQISEEQTKAFTEVKRKPEVSYTPDGRRLIDGKAEKEVDGVQLWHSVIKKRTLTPSAFGVEAEEEGEATEAVESTPAAVVTVTEEPVVTAAPKREADRK